MNTTFLFSLIFSFSNINCKWSISFHCCMGTVQSWPEPLIDHLRQGLGQLWEHRWRQFTYLTGRPHLRADYHWGRIFFWRYLLFGVFHCKPRSLDISEHFFFASLFCTMIIFLTITPVKYHSNHATLSTQHLLTVQEDTGRWVQVVLREVLTWFKNYVFFFFLNDIHHWHNITKDMVEFSSLEVSEMQLDWIISFRLSIPTKSWAWWSFKVLSSLDCHIIIWRVWLMYAM